MRPIKPLHHLHRWRDHTMRHFETYGSGVLTAILLIVAAIAVWIAMRGSVRMKAAAAVWLMLP